jgi:PAS domain S-box-containing protein
MENVYVVGSYALINAILAVLVLLRSSQRTPVRFYTASVSLMLVFGTIGLLLGHPALRAYDPLLAAGAVILYALFPFFFLHFVVVLLGRDLVLISRRLLRGIYVAGTVSLAAVAMGYLPTPLTSSSTMALSGHVFYVTWMSVLFSIGVAMLYSSISGFRERVLRPDIMLIGFAFLIFVLPGSVTQSTIRHIFRPDLQYYFSSATVGLVVAIYLIFRHKIVVNSPYTSLQSALCAMNDVLLKTDEDFRIELARGDVLSRFGYTQQELVGRNLRDLVEGHEYLDNYCVFAWRGKMRECFFDSAVTTKSGSTVEMNFSLAPVYAHDAIVGFVAVGRDITDRLRAEQQIRQLNERLEERVDARTRELRAANKQLMRTLDERNTLERQLHEAQKMESIGVLAGGIAHDFNNILSIVMAHASVLRRKKIENPAVSTSIDAIRQAVQRGTGVVRQLLTFARKTEVKREPVNPNDVVRELAAMIRETFPRTITVSLKLEEDLPWITADRNQLHQTLLNLFINARDAMAETGTLTVETRVVPGTAMQEKFPDSEKSRRVVICVSDTGSGMDEATRARIFEPFFSTKEYGKGTGLGLAVVYGIVKAHEGFINVHSTPGIGTSFELYFPVDERVEHMAAAEAIPEGVAAPGRETLLVVEDETTLREVAARSLRENGYRVFTAADGIEALEQFNEHCDDILLVITDIGLPRMSGFDAIRKMRELNPDIRIIVTTGYLDPKARERASKANIQRLVDKPYEIEEILNSVREVIDEKPYSLKPSLS